MGRENGTVRKMKGDEERGGGEYNERRRKWAATGGYGHRPQSHVTLFLIMARVMALGNYEKGQWKRDDKNNA